MCLAVGVLNNGTLRPDGGEQTKKHRRFLVCDHITPHKGDQDAFWSGPFQTLCPDHHDKQKQIEENRGYSTSVGVDGWPIDPNHPGNRGR